ncbi:hypothetical protein JL101_011890 [Skermanella rosea]|uniref:Uncharacterized protein n=1 Tax=Skermanella cutis TaxID=2775420 RepID=A0ABX7BBX9_9PROT|nr:MULTISPECIES: hypothetical protein [Skermanella]QQP91897.1 hypothetical protein IGS68_12120 [Skermanella sp. TT6]UEM06098.1 hypothetical protein JL101_011890 [Skermanella rosea]
MSISANPKDVQIVIGMARTLAADITDLQRQSNGGAIKTFLHYKKVRENYLGIQSLIFTVEDRFPRVEKSLPTGFKQWVIRAKLKALSAFTHISHVFFSNPPLTLTHSLGAWDILSDEMTAFAAVNGYFDNMIFEAGIDDKTADALEATRIEIEEIVGMLETLLKSSPKRLEEF